MKEKLLALVTICSLVPMVAGKGRHVSSAAMISLTNVTESIPQVMLVSVKMRMTVLMQLMELALFVALDIVKELIVILTWTVLARPRRILVNVAYVFTT